MKYLFVFGNTPDLSKAELEAVLKSKNFKFTEIIFEGKVLCIDSEELIPEEIFNLLGGTVKVGEVVENTDFSDITSKKIDFGVSFLGKSDYSTYKKIFALNKEIKAELAERGIKGRFVLPPKGETELSSVVVKKQMLVEYLLFRDFIAKTIWVQDFEDWGKRDYGKPQVEAHAGMLPPKVARMMVNLAGCDKILDPFCGTGTILMEALTIGLSAIGSDIDSRQVERARKNLEWLGKPAQLLVSDATKISQKISGVEAIVTEADLGPRSGLDQLYIECFKNWKGIAKTIVIALPSLNIIDKVKSMGYTLESGPFIYARPQAIIKRHILVFKDGTY